MILVTVGMHNEGFDRLVRPMDELAAQLDEPVIIQYGSSAYRARNSAAFAFATSGHMEQLTLAARVIVCHAAAGSIILCLRLNKPLVVVPRRSQYHEVVDDHQLQLTRALDKLGLAVAVLEPSPTTLGVALQRARKPPSEFKGSATLVTALRQLLRAESAGRQIVLGRERA